MKLQWHPEGYEPSEELLQKVVKDLEKNLADTKPENLIFHHVFTTSKGSQGSRVFVWAKEGSDAFHCKYLEDPQWQTYNIDGKRIEVPQEPE